MPGKASHEDQERQDLELVPPANPATWRRERIGWAVLAVFLVAAVIGVFGAGPLSRTTISAGNVRLEYDRFLRMSAASALQITLSPDGKAAGEQGVTLDHAYLDRIRVHTVVPEPKRTLARPDAVEFVFATASDGAPVTAWFHITLDRPGVASGRLTAAGETLEFWQLAYP